MKIALPGQRPVDITPAVQRARARLRNLGAVAGSRVLISDESGPPLVATLLALVAEDCSIALVDHHLDEASLRHVLDQSAPDLILGRLPHGLVPVYRPPSEWMLDIEGTAPLEPRDNNVAPGTEHGGAALTGPWSRREDALILFTSGSSGIPKGVVRSGRAVVQNTRATQQAMGYRPEDVLLPLIPVTHQYGFSVVLLAWEAGATLVLGNPMRAVDSLREASVVQAVTVVDAAPSHYQAILEAQIQDRQLGADVRLWCVGGAPCPAAVRDGVFQAFGRPLLDGYGMTEMGNIALGTEDHPHGAGRPLEGVKVRVVDPVAPDRDRACGVPGRILVRSTQGFHRYLHQDGSRELLAWFDTGDIGHLDEHGCLHLMGRDGAVHRNGNTLHLAGLEQQLSDRGLETVLVVTDCPRTGARLTAFVHGQAPGGIKRRVRAGLPQYAWPNRVQVMAEFPVLANGKVDRAALLRLAQSV